MVYVTVIFREPSLANIAILGSYPSDEAAILDFEVFKHVWKKKFGDYDMQMGQLNNTYGENETDTDIMNRFEECDWAAKKIDHLSKEEAIKELFRPL